MSGYELNRFIDISQSDSEELTCSICHDIFRNPVVTNCCLQTFCEQCINDWLEKNNTCPYDRKELNKNQLSRPSKFEKFEKYLKISSILLNCVFKKLNIFLRAFTNMLGRLKIRCIYSKNGCETVHYLDSLEKHEKQCDKKLCNKCFCERSVKHDCIESLLASNRELSENNNELQKMLELATDKISSMKSEMENYLQTIQELTNNNEV